MSLRDYTFREAVPEDFEGIERLFADNNYSPKPHPGWTIWKYRQSPDGPARVFVAEDSRGNIVGSMAYMPRRFTSAQTGPVVVMQVVDMFVSPALRKRGVFLRLLDYARKRMDVPKIGVPNESSAAFGSKAGWQILGPHETWQFPVSLGGLLAGKKVQFMAPLADLISSGYEFLRLAGRPRDLEMKPVDRFQTDYALDPDVIHGIRSAEYLNWRFIDNPIGRYASYEFYDDGEPVGYCVYAQVTTSAVISDFVAARRQKGCLHLLVDHCRDAGMTHLNFSGAGLQLKKLGFIHRSVDGNCNKYKAPDGHWMITRCDIDSEVDRAPQQQATRTQAEELA